MVAQTKLFLDQLLTRHNINLDLFEDEMHKRYGQRYLEYRKNYRAAGEFSYQPEFPLYLMLEQTYACNLECPSCIHSLPQDKKRFNTDVGVMPRSLFDKIILEGEKNNCPSIAFQVNDEPLLVKDLPERVAFAKEHNFMDLILTTNGTLLTPQKIKDLIEAGITRILISLDAATEETYKKVRVGGDFSQVIENIKFMAEYKRENKLIVPVTRVSFVTSSLNIHEKELFLEKFSGLFDYIEFQGLWEYYDASESLRPEGAEKNTDFLCAQTWRKFIVRPNGDVLPCCSFYGYEIVLGNLTNTSIKEIFNGGRTNELRQEGKEGNYKNPTCISCSKSYFKS